MAKNKEVKPTLRSAYEWEQYMGVALMSYVSRTNCCYDEQFKKQLYIVNPDWFKGTEKSTLKRKKAFSYGSFQKTQTKKPFY